MLRVTCGHVAGCICALLRYSVMVMENTTDCQKIPAVGFCHAKQVSGLTSRQYAMHTPTACAAFKVYLVV